MPGSSPKRKRKAPAAPLPARRRPAKDFTPAEERWMEERLKAFDAAVDSAPSGRREGNIPRVSGLPDGFFEEEPPQAEGRGPLRD